jgi:hypothetical protein
MQHGFLSLDPLLLIRQKFLSCESLAFLRVIWQLTPLSALATAVSDAKARKPCAHAFGIWDSQSINQHDIALYVIILLLSF